MPVEAAMLDAMLGTFRTMLADCRSKNMTGPDMEAMETCMARMEQLGAEMNDMGAFSGQLMQEGLMMQFSDHYGKVLAAAAQQQYSTPAGEYDEAADRQLLNHTLQAYRDAITRLHDNQAQVRQLMGANATDADVLLQHKATENAVQELLKTGESGISYPEFLCAAMERGLDKLVEGSAFSRNALVYILDGAKATAASPLYIQKEREKLELYDRLCSQHPLHVPDSLTFTLGCEYIEWQHQPAINQWNKIKQSREQAVFWLDEWITACCDFAPVIQPWNMAPNPREAVIESQECVPGKLRAWEAVCKRYFDMDVQQLLRHDSFKWDVEHHWLYWSQAYMEFLLLQVEPLCRPGARPPEEMINQAAAFHKEHRKPNPMLGEPARRYAVYFDQYFGTGEYAKRFGMQDEVESRANRWDWGTYQCR